MLKDLLSKLAKYLPSKALPAISGLITLPIISRLFTPEIYGNYTIALTLTDFLVAATCSGLASGAVRFFAEFKKKSALGRFFVALSGNLAVTICVTFLVAYLGIFLARDLFSPLVYYLMRLGVVVYALRAVSTVYLGVPRAMESAGVYTTFSLLFRYVSLAVGLCLILLAGRSIDGLLWGEIGAHVVLLPILILAAVRGVKVRARDFSMEDSRAMFRWAWPLLIGNIAMWGLNLSDRYIVALFRPQSELGFYSMAYGITDKSMEILVAIFILTVTPSLINTWETFGRTKAEESLTMVTRVYLVTALPAAVGLAALGLPVLRLLTTPLYFEGHRAVGLVAFSIFFWGLSMFGTIGMIVSKQTMRIGMNQLVAAGVNIGLNFLLVPRFGFVAAAITTLAGFVLLFGLQAHSSQKVLTWHFPFSTAARATASSGAMLVFLLVLMRFWSGGPGGLLAVGTTCGALVHFGVLGLLGEHKAIRVRAG